MTSKHSAWHTFRNGLNWHFRPITYCPVKSKFADVWIERDCRKQGLPHRNTGNFRTDEVLQVIQRLEDMLTQGGGKLALAMPRGSGKTTLVETAVVWALLYGHCRYIVIVGANSEKAQSILKNVKTALTKNKAYPQYHLSPTLKHSENRRLVRCRFPTTTRTFQSAFPSSSPFF